MAENVSMSEKSLSPKYYPNYHQPHSPSQQTPCFYHGQEKEVITFITVIHIYNSFCHSMEMFREYPRIWFLDPLMLIFKSCAVIGEDLRLLQQQVVATHQQAKWLSQENFPQCLKRDCNTTAFASSFCLIIKMLCFSL